MKGIFAVLVDIRLQGSMSHAWPFLAFPIMDKHNLFNYDISSTV